MIVDLTSWELQIAYLVGMRREQANLHKTDAAHYDYRRMEDNLRASLAASVCELAVAKATCRYWTMSAWDSGQHDIYRSDPDVLPNIEVKRVREPDNPLVVRRRDVKAERLIVTAYAIPDWFRSVDVIGWLPARTAWNIGFPSTYDPENTRLVYQQALMDISELTSEVMANA